MSRIKEFYHEQICAGMEEELRNAGRTFIDRNRNDVITAFENEAEDAQIIARAEEMAHSEMPNFLR